MNPFKAPALPLIARLFPRAKVVAVDRDPRDVVWSCFRRSFVASPVAREFTSFDRAARHHAALRRLTDRCVAILPLAAHRLAHEYVVSAFDPTTRVLCGFTCLPWSRAARFHRDGAGACRADGERRAGPAAAVRWVGAEAALCAASRAGPAAARAVGGARGLVAAPVAAIPIAAPATRRPATAEAGAVGGAVVCG